MNNKVPKYNELINPTFIALKCLGGSGSNKEILEQVIKFFNFDSSIIDIPHESKYTNYQSELEYRLAWARTYLSKSHIIESSSRAVWSICPAYTDVEELSEEKVKEIVKFGHASKKENDKCKASNLINSDTDVDMLIKEAWKSKLANVLCNMNPYGFERLSQRLLREFGFTKVEVTKKSGDGGIDGFGEYEINGIIAIKVAFQCKRYKGSVQARDIRDFRGSLTTDFEKAVFITTGTFTSAAKAEASKSGKLFINLIDGEELITKIAQMGIDVKEVKTYEIDEEFFAKI